jgi:hypothetical protein
VRRAPALLLQCWLALALTAACHHSIVPEGPVPEPVVLVVRNQSFFDVNVYAVTSVSGAPVRLAMVTSNSTATVKVPPTELQSGYALVVRLHAIGSRFWWDSPSVTVDASTIARLDITSDPDGNLSRSSLYLSVAPDSSDGSLGDR